MEFKYVTGDLDKIDLTAPIYPLRDHMRGVGLYGVDIAWLLEHSAAWDRFRSKGGYSTTYTFTHKLDIGQARDAIAFKNPVLIKPTATFSSKEFSTSQPPSFNTAYADCFYSDSELPDPSDGWGGYKLTGGWLANTFAMCAKMKRSRFDVTMANDRQIHLSEQCGQDTPYMWSKTYTHWYWNMSLYPGNSGSYTCKASNSAKPFSTDEVASCDCVIAAYSCDCWYSPPHQPGEDPSQEEKWSGFKVFNGASFNESQLADAAVSIVGAHGFTPVHYTSQLEEGLTSGQDLIVDFKGAVVIKRFSSRFDF